MIIWHISILRKRGSFFEKFLDQCLFLERQAPAIDSQSLVLAIWQGSEHASVPRSANSLCNDFRLCTISGILRTLAYSKLCIFKHIQAYSLIIVIMTFFFSLTYFSAKFKKTCFLITITSYSMSDRVYLNNTWYLEIAL